MNPRTHLLPLLALALLPTGPAMAAAVEADVTANDPGFDVVYVGERWPPFAIELQHPSRATLRALLGVNSRALTNAAMYGYVQAPSASQVGTTTGSASPGNQAGLAGARDGRHYVGGEDSYPEIEDGVRHARHRNRGGTGDGTGTGTGTGGSAGQGGGVSAVPLPAGLPLLASALGLLGLRRVRRRFAG